MAHSLREHLIEQGVIVPLESRPTLRLDARGREAAVEHACTYIRSMLTFTTGFGPDPCELPWRQDPAVMP